MRTGRSLTACRGGGRGGVCQRAGARGGVSEGRGVCQRGVCWGVSQRRCVCQRGVWSHGGWFPSMHWGRPPPINRMTDRCKNITLATTSLRPAKMWCHSKIQRSVEYLWFCQHEWMNEWDSDNQERVVIICSADLYNFFMVTPNKEQPKQVIWM